MRFTRESNRIFAAGLSLVILALAGCTQPAMSGLNTPRTLVLGENLNGSICTATSVTPGGALDPAMRNGFQRKSYLVNCRGVSGALPVGHIRVVDRTAAELARLEEVVICGTESASPVQTRAGQGSVSKCYDTSLGTNELVRLDVEVGEYVLIGTAPEESIGAIETGLALIAESLPGGTAPQGSQAASFDYANVAPAPAEGLARAQDVTRQASALAIIRDQGVELNRRGLFLEASRLLNDALSRTGPGGDAQLRADLVLEASLADSNIQFFESANNHFAAAEALLSGDGAANDPFRARKLLVYRALDAINRGDYDEARAQLSRRDAQQPLLDMDIVSGLVGQSDDDRFGTSSILDIPDAELANQLFLSTQEDFALARVETESRNFRQASAALQHASQALDALRPVISASAEAWIGSRIKLQEARLQARQGQYSAAVDTLSDAELLLTNENFGAQAAIALVGLERANFFSQTDAPAAEKRRTFAEAIELYSGTDQAASMLPAATDAYFALLIDQAAVAPSEDLYADFFAALQAAGEPETARQLNALLEGASSDPEIASLRRQVTDLSNVVTRERYRINSGTLTAEQRAAAEESRRDAEARLVPLRAALYGNPDFQSLNDQPVTLRELRSSLGDGEGYLKIVELTSQIVAMYVTQDESYIYYVARDFEQKRDLAAWANNLRYSMDGVWKESFAATGNARIGPYDALSAFRVFGAAAGPARQAIANTRTIAVDANGPFENLPFGALLMSFDQEAALAHRRKLANRQYGDARHLDFVARHMSVSTSISPRLFLVNRQRAASQATRNFMGLGTHIQPGEGPFTGTRQLGASGCAVPTAALARTLNRTRPIDDEELQLASRILDPGSTTLVTQGAFTDTALQARSDLDQYKVLHFATHGLTEGQFASLDCPGSPPGLLTSFGDGTSDGLLSFDEIRSLDLDANLVVLSACDTATGVSEEAARTSGQEDAGGTLSGLVRSFFVAQSRAVMATYWIASDEPSTVQFMETFYTSAQTADMAASVQDAQERLIQSEEYSHPFYWATFFLVGDGSKNLLAGA